MRDDASLPPCPVLALVSASAQDDAPDDDDDVEDAPDDDDPEDALDDDALDDDDPDDDDPDDAPDDAPGNAPEDAPAGLRLPPPPPPPPPRLEPPAVQATIRALALAPHIEGGYFVVTDLSPQLMPSPYPTTPLSARTLALVGGPPPDFDPRVRRLSSSILYYLTPGRPVGCFHRNRSRIVHAWHRGRGRYVLVHAGGRVESFVVGPDVQAGERLQWAVDGGVWKASYLLGPRDGAHHDDDDDDLLVSETVVPGFEYADHELLSRQACARIMPRDMAQALDWLLRP